MSRHVTSLHVTSRHVTFRPYSVPQSPPRAVETEHNDERVLLAWAVLCFHRGFHPDDLERVGIPKEVGRVTVTTHSHHRHHTLTTLSTPSRQVGVMEIEQYLNSIDRLARMEGAIATTNRCAMVLMGLGREMG